MATRDRVKAQREASKPLSREDLKDLVVALGGLVRESVREEIQIAIAPMLRENQKCIESIDAFLAEASRGLGSENTAMSDPLGGLTVVKVDHATREIHVANREHVDGEVVAKRERGGMLGP